jgi:uncharacterized protein
MSRTLRTAAGVAGLGAATLAYGVLVERNAFTVRQFDVPVLQPGSAPLRILHISDLHMTPNQRRKHQFVRDLAELRPDLVVNTGDTISHARAIPAIMRSLDPLFAFPGVFVPGNNDYYVPRLKNPFRYFVRRHERIRGPRLPWAELAAAMEASGWVDLTHVRAVVKAGDVEVALAGTDDSHLKRARYSLIAGPAEPAAAVRIGVTHSPEPALLRSFARDGYELVLAGHTHGGQVRVPFGPAIVTNCGIDVRRARWLHKWDDQTWFHVSAGLGTGPYSPLRIACRPEATLLTLVAR